MKLLVTSALALLLLSIESVVVKYLGFSVVRIDVTVALIAFLALRASTIEGAISAFAIGYFLDVMGGRPTGLFVFLAVFLFVLGRLAASLVDVDSAVGFVLFAIGADIAHGLLATLLSWMTQSNAPASWTTISSLPIQALLTALAAALLYPLLRKLEPSVEGSELGLL